METALLNVIKKYKVESVIQLADVLGVLVRYDKMPDEIGGLYYIDENENTIIIVINREIGEHIQLFVCAYLLAHHALNEGTYFCFLDENSSHFNYYILALKLLRATIGKFAYEKEG
jgi:Zn-dependent peptidase ImmA (M78 family)